MSRFDEETAVSASGDGTWTAHVHEQWTIGANPNGGYLVAIALRAVQALSAHADPLSVTTHFLRPGSGGEPAEVGAEVIRSGRSITTARARLAQAGSQRIEVVVAMGDLGTEPAEGPSLTLGPPDDMPPPDRCIGRSGDEQGVELPILERLDTVIHPAHAGGGQAGRAELAGWIRFADGRPPDALAAVLFCDAFPPSLFGLLGVVGWVPTVELTVHVRRRPAPGWLCGRFTTSDLRGGRMIEDGALWDEDGELIAQSRQLGLLLAR